MDISPAVRDRINGAADALYEESGRRNIPTVGAVRALAKVNINDASECMREWRNTHAAHIEQPHLHVPDKLQQASASALQLLWSEALNLSNETLHLAQAGWKTERAEALVLSQQVAQACAEQGAELHAAQEENEQQKQEIKRLNDALAASQRRNDESECKSAELCNALGTANAKAIEIGKRADDLCRALEQAHASHAAYAVEQAALLQSKTDDIASLRADLKDQRLRWETAETVGRAELLRAIEEAAGLRGKLEGLADAQALANLQSRPRRQSDGQLEQ